MCKQFIRTLLFLLLALCSAQLVQAGTAKCKIWLHISNTSGVRSRNIIIEFRDPETDKLIDIINYDIKKGTATIKGRYSKTFKPLPPDELESAFDCIQPIPLPPKPKANPKTVGVNRTFVESSILYGSAETVLTDLNNDGTSDGVAIDFNSNTVQVSLGGPNAAMATAVNYPLGSGIFPQAIIAADFNTDGKPDLAVTLAGSAQVPGSVAILRGNGDGTFQARVNVTAGASPMGIAAADYNHDGKMDLAVTGGASGQLAITLLRGNGDGTFQAASQAATFAGSPSTLLVTDFNGDTNPDLLAGTDTGVALLIGNGDGTFRTPVVTATGDGVQFLVAGDVNNDSRTDIVAGLNPSQSLLVLTGNADGTFTTTGMYAGGLRSQGFVLLDANNDGSLDILAPSGLNNSVILMLGYGDGTFVGAEQWRTGRGPLGPVAADFTGDGLPDLVTANGFGSSFTLLTNLNDVFAPPQTIAVTDNTGSSIFWQGIATGDFNGDGKADLAGVASDRLHIFSGGGNGTFTRTLTSRFGEDLMDIRALDVNGDQRLDLVIADSGRASTNGAVWVVLNSATGLQSAVSYSAGLHPRSIATGDVNGDGRVDLAVANRGDLGGAAGGVSILIGNGAGLFGAPTQVTVGANPVGIAAGDLNEDGRIDLAVASGVPGKLGTYALYILSGKGNGTFEPPLAFPLDSPGPVFIVKGTDAPHAAVIVTGSNTTIFEGRGDGTFPPFEFLYAGANTTGLVQGQFDEDGHADLAFANAPNGPGAVTLLRAAVSDPNVVTHVSTAGYMPGPLAPNSFVSAFGSGLATGTAQATGAFPTVLGGTTVTIDDAQGVQRPAAVQFVSPGQVNYVIPAQTASGEAYVTIRSGDGTTRRRNVNIQAVGPGVFILNAQRLSAALLLRVRPSGEQVVEQLVTAGTGGQLSAKPIDLSSGDQLYLLLFGTGFRGRGTSPVAARIGGVDVPVIFAGAQGQFEGVDQVNIGPLPQQLTGRGEVDIILTLKDFVSNATRVSFR